MIHSRRLALLGAQQTVAVMCRTVSTSALCKDDGLVGPRPVPSTPASVPAKGKWVEVKDAQSGKSYFWNEVTGQTTPLGSSKPDAWVEVTDKSTGLTYYWNQQSGETTAVGEPMPGPMGRVAAGHPVPPVQGGGTFYNLVTYPLAVGLGFGLVFAAVRLVF